MSDRLEKIRARLEAASRSATHSWERWPTYDDLVMREPFPTDEQAVLAAHAPADIAWLLDEVERLRNTKASSPNPLCDESVVQDVTKLECSDG